MFEHTPARLEDGDRLIIGGEEFAYAGMVNGKRVFNSLNRPALHIADSDLLRTAQNGEAFIVPKPFVTRGKSEPESQPSRQRNAQAVPDVDQDALRKAELRMQYAIAYRKAPRGFRTGKMFDVIIREVAEKYGDKHPPVERTVRVWHKKLQDARDDVRALLDIDAQQPRSRRRRYSGKTVEYAHRSFQENYLAQPTAKIMLAVKGTENLIDLHNKALTIANGPHSESNPSVSKPLKCPSRSTQYRWARSFYDENAVKSKFGANTARNLFRHVKGRITADRASELYQLDSTQLDVACVTIGSEKAERPWLTLVQDVYSRAFVGYYLGFAAPSVATSLAALNMALGPKDWVREKFPQIAHQWLMCGMCEATQADNGPENSLGFRYACQDIGINFDGLPFKSPWMNGLVERLNQNLNNALQNLPGAVGHDPSLTVEKGGHRTAALTLLQIEEHIVRFIVENHNRTQNSTTGESPNARWKASIDKVGIRPAPPRDRLEVLASVERTAFAHHYGITYQGIVYNGDAVQKLRSRNLKPRTTTDNPAISVKIKIYEPDVSHIYLYDPEDKSYHFVPANDYELYDGIPRSVHLMIRKLALKIAREREGQGFRGAISHADYVNARTKVFGAPVKTDPGTRRGRRQASHVNQIISSLTSGATREAESPSETASANGSWSDFPDELPDAGEHFEVSHVEIRTGVKIPGKKSKQKTKKPINSAKPESSRSNSSKSNGSPNCDGALDSHGVAIFES